MADINTILERNIGSIKELKAAISELQNSLIGVDETSEEFKTTSEKLAAAQAELNKVTRAGKDDNNAAADSIRGMEKEYKALYDTYKKLTEEQRNSDFGKNMAESLENLSTKINDAKKDVGNFTSNIGRYAQGASEAFSKMGVSLGGLQAPLKAAAGGTKTFGTALKALAANPIILVITALVAILVKAAEAIKKNEELTNRLKEAMAVFKPVLDAVSNAFDFLAKLLVKTIEGLAKVAEKILSIIPGMKKAIQSHKDLAKATNELTKAQRENSVVASQKQAEIERLREEASATDDVIEKRKLLEEAKRIQQEVDQREIELAQEELRILQEYSEKTANSAEENEKLAAAQKKVNDAIAKGEQNMRMYNKQLAATETKTKSAGGAAKNYREEAKKLHEQLLEENKTEITKITEKYEKEKKLLEKYHYDTTLLTKKYQKEVAEIENAAALKRLEQRRSDDEKYLAVVKRRDEELALLLQKETLEQDTIPTLKKLQDEIQEIGRSLNDTSLPIGDPNRWKQADEFFDKAQEGFENLGDEYKDLKIRVQEINAEFGTNITNTDNLETSLEDLEQTLAEIDERLLEISGEEVFKKIDKVVKENKIDLFSELFSFDTGLTSFDEIALYKLEGEHQILEEQKKLYEEELAEFEGTRDQKLELMEQYYDTLAQLREKDRDLEELHQERSLAITEAAFEHYDALTSSLESVANAMETVIQSELDSGKLTEREAKKKERALKNLQKVQLAVSIANIAANTAAGIMDVWRGYSSELPLNAQTAAATGPGAAATKAALDAKSLAAAILRTSTIAVQGGAQIAAAVGGYIAKANASAAEAGGGGVSVGASPALIDSTPYSYTRTVQTSEEEEKLNQPIWVSVVDIESGLGQRAKVTEETSF